MHTSTMRVCPFCAARYSGVVSPRRRAFTSAPHSCRESSDAVRRRRRRRRRGNDIMNTQTQPQTQPQTHTDRHTHTHSILFQVNLNEYKGSLGLVCVRCNVQRGAAVCFFGIWVCAKPAKQRHGIVLDKQQQQFTTSLGGRASED